MPNFTELGHCVCILFSEPDGKLHIGYTTDLKQRLTDHFNGRNQAATALQAVVEVIRCSA